MSKAFTRESDEMPERPAAKPAALMLPPGVKNYLTVRGANDLRTELHRVTAEPVSPATRQRISEINQTLQSAVILTPPPLPWDQVLFGATVTIRNQWQESLTYRIVGVQETQAHENNISWRSPVAKALLQAHVGDRIRLRIPEGEQEWEIIKIEYEE